VAKAHPLLTYKQGNRTIDNFFGLTTYHCRTMWLKRLILQALILGIESDKIRKRLFDLTHSDIDKAIELYRWEEASAID